MIGPGSTKLWRVEFWLASWEWLVAYNTVARLCATCDFVLMCVCNSEPILRSVGWYLFPQVNPVSDSVNDCRPGWTDSTTWNGRKWSIDAHWSLLPLQSPAKSSSSLIH